MMLVLIILLLLAGGVLAWVSGAWKPFLPRVVAIAALAADAVLVALVALPAWTAPGAAADQWIAEFNARWMPQFGISFHLAADGLGLLMTALTVVVGSMALLCSRADGQDRPGFYHFNLLWSLAGITGVFLAVDLFLFYFFWEMMIVPLYFMIGVWGHENRGYASMKFFIFTQAGGLIMFLSILALYFLNGNATGTLTFDYMTLLRAELDPLQSRLLMAGFLAAFMVKLPALPFHTWLPDAHTEAPTAGSVILAGLLLKTGAYGILRFVIPLFPRAAAEFQVIAMAIGAAGILYGAVLAFAQTDLKRMVAYTSVSHMGFVLVGAFSMNELALQGVILQMICHAFSTGGLFILAGALQDRLHTRDIGRMGGFWRAAPRMGGVMLFFALASLGLPGLGNFAAEFMILAGAFPVNPPIASIASLGFIVSAVYALAMVQKIYHGAAAPGPAPADLSLREVSLLAPVMLALVCLGLFPGPVMDRSADTVKRIREITADVHGTKEIPGGAPVEGGRETDGPGGTP